MDQFLTNANGNYDELSLKMHQVQEYLEGEDYDNAKILLKEILEKSPEEPNANYMMGQFLEFDEDYKKAAECFEKSYKFSQHEDIKAKLLEAYELSDNFEKAYEIYQEDFKNDPKNLSLCERLAHIAAILGKNEDSLTYYNKILENDPENVVALTQLMDLYRDLNRYNYYKIKAQIHEIEKASSYAVGAYKKALNHAEKQEEIIETRKKIAQLLEKQDKLLPAIDQYHAILEIEENNFDILIKLAELYADMDHIDSAIETFEKALEIKPDMPEILKELADLYLEMEQFEKAGSLLQKILDSEKTPSNLVSLSKVELLQNNEDKALSLIKEALDIDSENIEAKGELANFYIKQNKADEALVIAKEIKEKLPKSPFSFRKLAEAYEAVGDLFNMHYNYAVFHRLKGETQLAIDEYTWAFNLQPDNKEVCIKLAELYYQIDELYIAVEYYEKAFAIDSNDVTSLEKAVDIEYKVNNYEKAAELINKILAIKETPEMQLKLGDCYYSYNQLEKALECYKNFVENGKLSSKTEEAKNKIAEIESKLYGEDDEGFLEKILRFLFK